MKLYLVDAYRIYTYSLPNKIEDAFNIHYVHYSGKEETITFMAEENQWVIQSTSEVQFRNTGELINKEVLQNNSTYTIQFSDLTDVISLYCFDTHQEFYDFNVGVNETQLSLGRAGNFSLLYDNPNIANPEFMISKQNNAWLLEDSGLEQTRIYVNNKRVRKCFLNLGDVIFTNGLKIIWMETFIKFNNPNGKIKTALSSLEKFYNNETIEENTYTPVKDTERLITLYNDDQVFFHTPRMKETIVGKDIDIERPPQVIEVDDTPAIFSIGTTAVMGVSSMLTGIFAITKVTSGKGSWGDVASEIILCITMLIGSIILPLVIENYNKRRYKKKEQLRKSTYREYLASIKQEIKTEIEQEQKVLLDNYLGVEQLKKMVSTKSNKIWNREITDNDFLMIRLGIGNQNAAIHLTFPKMAYDMDKDVLNMEAEEISNESLILNNVPITISLVDNPILPMVIANNYVKRKQFLNFLLLQLISYYSGNDLKIVVFTSQDNSSQWSFLKYLPHCANETRKFRFYAETDEEAKQVSNYLEKVFQTRWNKVNNTGGESDEGSESFSAGNEKVAYKFFDTYYLIITDDFVSAKRCGIIQKLLNNSTNIGFSLITIEPTMQNVPSKCNNIVAINESGAAGIVNKTLNENGNNNAFVPDVIEDDIKPYANIIGNIPLSTESTAGKLPKSISFLDMYKVGKIEQLNILNRWTKNDPTISIATPIGVHEDGKLFEIDLHEKYHGPHGLIAGSTGSGKSEFIITFILSMAINYHPYEVQFVLIDYKGGGLAGAFENKETGIRLPHLAGTITNLDVSEMNRTLVSINSELKRRQRMFNEARDALNESTVDIYKYQRFYREGKVKEPMSHLFIISDEFAELKSQQPDFMDALVSTARIGRSLGVHLILATQKPSGVVDDQIWSNSRFKICLKVATAEDSRELLRRSEAAEIKETGRFYLQVGFNELFELGQSAWTGAKYNPTDHIIKNIDDDIEIIDDVGTIIRSINDSKVESQENHGEQLTNIVLALHNLALREKIQSQTMWLPALPAEIYISNLIQKYQYQAKEFYIKPIVGEYDDPERQYQGEFDIDFTKKGNLLIYGLVGSGKENLVMTILYSICMYHTSEEVNIYLLDFGAEILKIFKDMPQVGDIALIDDNDKIKSILLMVEREQIRRKELFSEFGGSYVDYIQNSGQKMPMIFIVLNGWETFAETYGSYTDIIAHLLRECTKYGIVFITTMVTTNGMLNAVQQNFNNKIALQLSDNFDYKFLLNARDGLVPKKEFSRGLAIINEETYEFQGAYIYVKDQINDIIRQTTEKLSAVQKKAPPIPVIPATVTADTLTPYIADLKAVPLGVDIRDAHIFTFDFIQNKITQVIGNYIITDKKFLDDFLKVLNLLQDTKLKIIDFADAVDDQSEFEDYSNQDFTDTINRIIENEKTETKQMIYVLIGIGRVYDKVLDEGIETLFKILNNADSFKKSSFIIADNYSIYRKIMKEEWYQKVNTQVGVWVGADIESQTAITMPNLSKSDANEEFNGIIYASNGTEYSVLKGIGSRPEEEF